MFKLHMCGVHIYKGANAITTWRSAEQIQRFMIYEKSNKVRQSLIDRFDSKLRAS